MRERFGWSSTRHYPVLNALLDRPEAGAYDAQLVRRLPRVGRARKVAGTVDRFL